MIIRNFIFLLMILNSILPFSPKVEYSDYNNFISSYPGFIKTNFFEDSFSYYYLSKQDLNDSRINNAVSKLRLSSITDFTQSICCGFDVKLLENIRKLKIIDITNSTCDYNMKIESHSANVAYINYLFHDIIDNVGIYAMKILKKDISILNKCDCKIKIN